MKSLLVFTAIAFCAVRGTTQKVEFFPNETRGLDKIFTLSGNAGQSTVAKNLWLYNHTSQTLRVYARPHVQADALYFTNTTGKTSREYSLQLAPGASSAFQLFGYAAYTAGSYAGYLALAATSDGMPEKTRTVKLPINIQFTPKAGDSNKKTKPLNKPQAWTKPDRYEVILSEGLPVRWHLAQLPLKVYSNHVHTGDTTTQYEAVVRRAIEVWNKVGRDNGLNRDFFRLVQQPQKADIQLFWTGKYLLPGSEGTAYPSDGYIGLRPLSHYRGAGRAAETLLQELCHMLGVAHSAIREDIMYSGTHSHNLDLSKLSVTDRDKQMIGWLYSLGRYVALGK